MKLSRLKNVINQFKADFKYLAHLDDTAKSLATLLSQIKAKGSVCMLIGAEGGFSLEEVELAKVAGFQVVLLGNKRLRTETAAVVAVALINA